MKATLVPSPVVALALSLLVGTEAAAQCTGSPPPAAAPRYVYSQRTCEVVEYTVNVLRNPPPAKTIPLKLAPQVCPNCDSQGFTCSVTTSAGDTKTIETTISAKVGVPGFELGTSFSYSISYSSEATAGCQVAAPRCRVTVLGQELAAEVVYRRIAKERFEYQRCNFFRRDGSSLGGTSGAAVSCGYEAEKVEASVTVTGRCRVPEHRPWKCPDPKCPQCCPADEEGSYVPSPSFERGGAALAVAPTAFSGGTLSGYVLDPQDRPVAGAPVSLGGDGTLAGTVTTDVDGRFEVAVPEDQRTVELAVAALGVTAVSRVASTADPVRADDSPAELARPGEILSIPGDYPRARLAQGEIALELPTARSVSRDGGTVESALLVARELRPGAARLTLTDATDQSFEYPITLYEVTAATIERENLLAGQSAVFGWDFALGSENGGETLTVCAAVTGPVRVEGELCGETVLEADGTGSHSGTVRALPGFQGAFSITPVFGR